MKAQSIEVIFILALMLITFSIALIFPYVSEIGKYGAGYQETSQPVSENIITFTYLTNKTKGFGNNPSFFKEHQVIERISVPYDEELISIVTPDKEILISSKISPSPKLDEAFYNYNILKDYNLESLPIIVEYNVPKAEVKTRTITTSAIAQTTINTVSRKINNLGQVSKTFRFSPLISAKVSSSNLVELAQLSEVKKIWLDRKVEIQLNDSIEIINADDVWDQTDITGNEITGKGIRIAILDTGIDSSHPDFAGKIIAQNDFVPAQYFIDSIDYGDGDDDVVADDHHGHGTHVASIAAGSGAASGGKYKGVAPGAWLVPVKVLNNDGIGFESWIIEAIEY
ncbi:MAG: S8 family serine peptidase, partial [Candidatus Aenigmatarchaeota archaeon]